jgi:TolB-like protein/Tfp pilus assembly protein PilF
VASAAPAPTSVAVLYFDNLSRDSSDVYLADGLTEELIDRLGQIERLAVKSRTAVQRFRGRTLDDPTAIGRTLSVAHLVSGSVRRSGNRLRVTAELTRAATGVRVWGETFERASDDLMTVEAEIAQAIALGIGGRLAPAERRSLAERPTANAGAYDHYLRANYLLARRTPVDVRAALDGYEAAARLDPSFARAMARIGLGYALFVDWGWPYPELSPDSLLQRGFAATDRALRLDSTSADAWMARGFLLEYRNPRTFEGALPAFERAVALDPRNAEAHHQFGGLFRYLNQYDAALRVYRRALALEPERAITLANISFVHLLRREYEDAARVMDSAIAADPGAYYAYGDQGWIRLLRGDLTGTRASAESALRFSPPGYASGGEALMAAVEARAGDTVAARARLDRVTRGLSNPDRPGVYDGLNAAMGYAQIGDRRRALDIIERVAPRGILLWSYLQAPQFDPIRDDPRFQRLLGELRPPGVTR